MVGQIVLVEDNEMKIEARREDDEDIRVEQEGALYEHLQSDIVAANPPNEVAGQRSATEDR